MESAAARTIEASHVAKLHLAVDPETHEIIAEVLTTNGGMTPIWRRHCWVTRRGKSTGSLPTVLTISGRYTTPSSNVERGRRSCPTRRQDQAAREHGRAASGSRGSHSQDPPHRPEELEKELATIDVRCETAVFRLKTIFGPYTKTAPAKPIH